MSWLKVHLARVKKYIVKTLYKALDRVMDTDKHIKYTYYQNGYHNPDYYFEKSQINFMHLPKTGGTSICKILEGDPEKRFAHLNIHKPVSVHCSPSNYKYVTVLRDPIARVWSYYQMVLRSEKGYPYQKWANQGLEIFLQKCWAARDLACRYLSGEMTREPNEKTLELAMSHLRQFYVVMNFADFSQEVSTFMARHKIPYEKIPNERNHKYTPPTEIEKELIRKYNPLDMALFQSWFDLSKEEQRV